jgi:hypothetical protein
MLCDECPDPESFRRIFEAMRCEIEPMMAEVGVTSEPEITFWRKLETHDDVGWKS